MDAHGCLACFRVPAVSGGNVKQAHWQFRCVESTDYGGTCKPQLQSLFSSLFAVKNCSYFKHFTSGEEAEVFEVKTQKGKVYSLETWEEGAKVFTLDQAGMRKAGLKNLVKCDQCGGVSQSCRYLLLIKTSLYSRYFCNNSVRNNLIIRSIQKNPR